MSARGGLAVLLLAGCVSARPEGERLGMVVDVEGIQATGRQVLGAIKKRDPAAAIACFTPDFREGEPAPSVPVAAGSDPAGFAVLDYRPPVGPEGSDTRACGRRIGSPA